MLRSFHWALISPVVHAVCRGRVEPVVAAERKQVQLPPLLIIVANFQVVGVTGGTVYQAAFDA